VRAARFHGRRDIRIEDVPEPAVRPGTVKIRVEWCGICGTDLHEYTDGPIFCPSSDVPHPLTGETAPVIMGHEFAGKVTAIGAGVTRVRPGDRVAVEPRVACGACPACRSGLHNCCRDAATIGLAGGGGGLAEFIVVDEALVFDIGDLPFEVGALVEPLAVAHHAIRRSGLRAGQTALVMGAGPIGLLITSVLKALGASVVMLSEPAQARRAHGAAAGADVTIDPRAEDVAARVAALTGGVGADVAFECAGIDAALTACLEAVKAGGTIVNVAIRASAASVDLLPLVLKEISLMGTICYAGDHAPVIELLREGRLDVSRIVSSRIDLADLVTDGFDALLDDAGGQVKILVRP